MTLAGKRVLVTGGTGFIGGRLVEKLILDQKAEVRVLVRNFSSASRIARFDLDMVAGNISDWSTVDKAAKDCDVVFHCAYDFGGARKQRERVNVKGTENVAKAALQYGAGLVHVSTIDVYGRPCDRYLNEMAPKKPIGNIYADTKLAAEQLVLDYHRRYDLPVTVIQPTIVYGPFSRPWTITPVRQLKSGQLVLADGGEGCCNAVYVDDVVDALLLAATKEKAIGETFLISGSEPITWREFYSAYEEILGLSSTVSMSTEEVERAVREQERDNGTWRQLVLLFRDPSVYARLLQIPGLSKIYARSGKHLQDLFRKIPVPNIMINETFKDSKMEKPMHIPDRSRLELYRSRTIVKIDKAQHMLGYNPQFGFEQGMVLTEQFIRWANLI